MKIKVNRGQSFEFPKTNNLRVQIGYIKSWVCAFRSDPEIVYLAKRFKRRSLTDLYNYLFYNFKYVKDPEGISLIRSPYRFLKDKRGNCIDFSVFAASIFLNNNLNPYFVVAGKNKRNISHIWIKILNIDFDPVLGLDRNSPMKIFPGRGIFNYTKEFKIQCLEQ